MTIVPVFVSSTFSDFHGERDVLRTIVAPALDALLAPMATRVELLDLRWGVDTTTAADEVRAQQQVLDVCVAEIERCRPLFLGLVGDRFGWVPPQERLLGTQAPVRLSVTGLEFWYGVLAPEARAEAVVGIRRLSSGAPPEWRDEDPAGVRWLRDSVKAAAAGTPNRVRTFEYRTVVRMTDGRATIREEDLEMFADTVVQLLSPLAVARARELEDVARTPYQAAAALALEARSVIEGRDEELSAVRQALGRPETRGVVLLGPSGVGKTTVWEAACGEAEADGYQVHRVIVGAGPSSTSTVDVVSRLADELGVTTPDLGHIRAREGEAATTERFMQWWAGILAAITVPTVLAVDGLDRLGPGTARETVEVLRSTMVSSPVRYLASTTLEEQARALVLRGMTAIEIADLPPTAVRLAAAALARAGGRRQLPDAVLDVFAAQSRSGLWLRLAVTELGGIDATVFARAEAAAVAGADPAQALAQVLLDEARAMPSADSELANRALERVALHVGDTRSSALLLGALALSRSGMAPADLQAFAVIGDTLRFTRSRRLLGGQIAARDDTGRLAFDHQLVRQAALDRYIESTGDQTLRRLHALLAAQLSQDAGGAADEAASTDPVAVADRVWHSLMSSDPLSTGAAMFRASTSGMGPREAGELIAQSMVRGRSAQEPAALAAISGLAESFDDAEVLAAFVQQLHACEDEFGESDLRLSERRVLTAAELRLARRLLLSRDDQEATLLLCGALEHVSRVAAAAGDEAGPNTYGEALEIARRLTAADPASPAAARQLWSLLSAPAFHLLDVVAARETRAEALSLARGFADSDSSRSATRDLISTLLVAGRDLDDHAAKLTTFDEALMLARGLAAGDPDDQLALRDLIDALTWVGLARMALSDFRGAQQANAEAIFWSRQVLARDPGDLRLQRQLAATLYVFGMALLGDGQRKAARETISEAVQIRKEVASADPENIVDAHELGHALWGMARTLRAQFRLVKAAKHYAEYRRVENSTRAGGRPPVSGPGGTTFDGQAAGIQEIYWPADADNPFRRSDRGIWSDELAQAATSSSLPFPAPPQQDSVPGWRFASHEEGLAFWNGSAYTGLIGLPVSVRDLDIEEVRHTLLRSGSGPRAVSALLDRLLLLDEGVRHYTLGVVSATAAYEALDRCRNTRGPWRLWDEAGVVLVKADALAISDGSGSIWGKSLTGGTTSRSRTLYCTPNQDEILDRGILRLDAGRIEFQGTAMNRLAEAKDIEKVEFNVLRGEFIITGRSEPAGWKITQASPEAVAIAQMIGHSKGALAQPRMWEDAGYLGDYLRGATSVMEPDRSKGSVARLTSCIADYLAALPGPLSP